MNTAIKRIFGLLFFTFSLSSAFAQNNDLIQFSGVIVEIDSLRPIPFTRVLIKNSGRGTIADYSGYFSFVAQKKDTIIFSAIGYRRAEYVIPDTLSGNKYSLIQTLTVDSIILATVVIYPYPTPEDFKRVFMENPIPDDDLDRAMKNMAREEMKEKLETMAMDGSMNYKATMQQYQSRLYWANQYPPNNLLNPFAWAQFVKMWREGKLKVRKGTDTKEE